MSYFEPKGERSLREMVLAGLEDFPPLEAGTVITYDQISEWLGEDFPRRIGDYGERSYEPMSSVGDHLLAAKGVLLLNVESVGYRVANDAEKVAHAERWGYLAALTKMRYGNAILNSVDRRNVSSSQAALADFMQRELVEEQRVMRAKLRAEHKRANAPGN